MHTTTDTTHRRGLSRRLAAAAAITAGLATGAACAAPAEDTASATDALAELDEVTRTHVEFEAAWQCDLTRFAFDDLAEIETMRIDQLDAYGLTEEAHTEFVARLDTEPDLAEMVSELSGDCAGTDVDLDGPVEL
jgi:hypothetical protein